MMRRTIQESRNRSKECDETPRDGSSDMNASDVFVDKQSDRMTCRNGSFWHVYGIRAISARQPPTLAYVSSATGELAKTPSSYLS
jgi:hypothetical protein